MLIWVLVSDTVIVTAWSVKTEPVAPAQEQAEEYRTVPEQADAYVGVFDGVYVNAAQSVAARL